MKNVIKIGAIWFILFFSDLSTATGQIPSAVSEAAQAVVKVTNYLPNGNSIQGTGFAVTNQMGQVFIVTNFDMIHRHSLEETPMQLREDSVELEAPSGQILKIKSLTDFSLFNNLFLIEVTGYKGPTLQLSRFNKAKDKVAYLVEFPWNRFDQSKQMKIVGLVSSGKTTLSGFSYFFNRDGNGGGPLLDEKGAVIGVTQNGRLDHMPYFTKSAFLKELLKRTESELSETDSASRFTKEMNSLIASAKAGDSEAHFRLVNIRMNTHHDDPEELLNDPAAIDLNNWKNKAIQTGDMRSLYAVGLIVHSHINIEESWPIWELAAKKGHPGAMYQIGLKYLFIEENKKQAIFWFKKAASKGCPDSKVSLAKQLYDPNRSTSFMSLLIELTDEGFPRALNFSAKSDNEGCSNSWSNLRPKS